MLTSKPTSACRVVFCGLLSRQLAPKNQCRKSSQPDRARKPSNVPELSAKSRLEGCESLSPPLPRRTVVGRWPRSVPVIGQTNILTCSSIPFPDLLTFACCSFPCRLRFCLLNSFTKIGIFLLEATCLGS